MSHSSPQRRKLNNSSEISSAAEKTNNKILDVYNMLNPADKENVYNMEKNLARSLQTPVMVLRPALRSSNHEQKVFKQIRFNLSKENSEALTPTPPPKEFKRMGNQRKTLRNARCMSTIVTEKERALLHTFENSPKAPQGFVKSMCKFYADNFTSSTSKSALNRSNSFSGTESPESGR